MIFDYVIMNPPYNRNIHFDFFNKALTMTNEVICIHPSGPFFSRRPTKVQKRVKTFKENIKKYKTSIELIDGNLYFSAGLFVPLSITHTNKNINGNGVVKVGGYYNEDVSVDKLNYFGSAVEPLYECISDDNLLTRSGSFGNFYVSIGLIRGHQPIAGERFNSDFFTMVPESYKVETQANLKWHHYGFETIEEAEKFLEYIKSDYARVFLALYKNNQHLDSGTLEAVPYPDLTKQLPTMRDWVCEYMSILPYYGRETRGGYGSGIHNEDKNRVASDFDIERKKTTHEVFTPNVVTDMLLKRVTDWNGSFLDPACGDGNILYRIAERRLEMGHDKETIAHQLFGFDIVESNVVACRQRLIDLIGYPEVFNEHIKCNDFLLT